MDQVSDSDAKERLGALLDAVERGGEVVITREGRAVARLVPEVPPKMDAKTAAAGLLKLRSEIAARGVSVTSDEIREMREDGWR